MPCEMTRAENSEVRRDRRRNRGTCSGCASPRVVERALEQPVRPAEIRGRRRRAGRLQHLEHPRRAERHARDPRRGSPATRVASRALSASAAAAEKRFGSSSRQHASPCRARSARCTSARSTTVGRTTRRGQPEHRVLQPRHREARRRRSARRETCAGTRRRHQLDVVRDQVLALARGKAAAARASCRSPTARACATSARIAVEIAARRAPRRSVEQHRLVGGEHRERRLAVRPIEQQVREQPVGLRGRPRDRIAEARADQRAAAPPRARARSKNAPVGVIARTERLKPRSRQRRARPTCSRSSTARSRTRPAGSRGRSRPSSQMSLIVPEPTATTASTPGSTTAATRAIVSSSATDAVVQR